MSKLLVNLALLPTKAIVNTWTWSTLPFYALAQRPWRRLKLAKHFNVRVTTDAKGRTIYSRPPPLGPLVHPHAACKSYNDLLATVDRSRKIIGTREVLSEVPQLDPATGEPIKVDGRELTKLKLADAYRWYTVGEILDKVDDLARGLQGLGVKEGDKVLLYAENSLEWIITSMALLRINATTVTLLSILNDDGILYGINQCQATHMIISQDLLRRLARISPSIATPLNVVYIQNPLNPNDPKTLKAISSLQSASFTISTYKEVQESGSKLPVAPFPQPRDDSISVIMYTSGTTGNPKGVMLTNKNLQEGYINLLHFDRELEQTTGSSVLNSRYPAYLPMAHLYGYVLQLGLFVNEARVAICSPMTMLESSPGHVPGQVPDFALIKPNFIGGVPLVLDRILKEIYRKLNARSPISAPIFTYLMEYKIRWTQRGFDTPIINRLVCRKINGQFGGQLKVILCGSAALNERTQAMIQAALNVRIIQGYGSTEMTAASHLMAPGDTGFGECGIPLANFKHYLKDWPEGGYFTSDKPNPRGEIVTGGDCITAGYYKMPKETEESYKVDEDGTRWFESGDIVEMLPNGTVKVIDRKKDLTKLANGEFVSLGKIESGLRSSPYVENICVCTDPYSNYVTALVSPNRRAIVELGGRLGKADLSFERLCGEEDVVKEVIQSFKGIGKQLKYSKKELPAKVTLVTEEWTVDNALLTAAMKMKRKEVNAYYKQAIVQMFEKKE